jgi:hypothetical protein
MQLPIVQFPSISAASLGHHKAERIYAALYEVQWHTSSYRVSAILVILSRSAAEAKNPVPALQERDSSVQSVVDPLRSVR